MSRKSTQPSQRLKLFIPTEINIRRYTYKNFTQTFLTYSSISIQLVSENLYSAQRSMVSQRVIPRVQKMKPNFNCKGTGFFDPLYYRKSFLTFLASLLLSEWLPCGLMEPPLLTPPFCESNSSDPRWNTKTWQGRISAFVGENEKVGCNTIVRKEI